VRRAGIVAKAATASVHSSFVFNHSMSWATFVRRGRSGIDWSWGDPCSLADTSSVFFFCRADHCHRLFAPRLWITSGCCMRRDTRAPVLHCTVVALLFFDGALLLVRATLSRACAPCSFSRAASTSRKLFSPSFVLYSPLLLVIPLPSNKSRDRSEMRSAVKRKSRIWSSATTFVAVSRFCGRGSWQGRKKRQTRRKISHVERRAKNEWAHNLDQELLEKMRHKIYCRPCRVCPECTQPLVPIPDANIGGMVRTQNTAA